MPGVTEPEMVKDYKGKQDTPNSTSKFEFVYVSSFVVYTVLL